MGSLGNASSVRCIWAASRFAESCWLTQLLCAASMPRDRSDGYLVSGHLKWNVNTQQVTRPTASQVRIPYWTQH